jgi:hypothetical protein
VASRWCGGRCRKTGIAPAGDVTLMDRNAWLGLMLGVAIGAAYGLWQRWGMGAGPKPDAVRGAFAGLVVRLIALVAAIFLALRFTEANRMWLIGGVMVSYGLLFAAMMCKVLLKKK